MIAAKCETELQERDDAITMAEECVAAWKSEKAVADNYGNEGRKLFDDIKELRSELAAALSV